MRTNIDLDDELLSKAMRGSGLKTKRAVVRRRCGNVRGHPGADGYSEAARARCSGKADLHGVADGA